MTKTKITLFDIWDTDVCASITLYYVDNLFPSLKVSFEGEYKSCKMSYLQIWQFFLVFQYIIFCCCYLFDDFEFVNSSVFLLLLSPFKTFNDILYAGFPLNRFYGPCDCLANPPQMMENGT